jgi:aspartate/methionine/tyrosine aminotransferase
MEITPFALERYYAKHEFTARYLLSSSDCDGLAMAELLSWADDELRAAWDGLRLGYTESPGHPLLRAAIALLYDGVDPDEIITFVPEEAIFAAMNCLVRPGDHVVCTFPGYQSLYEVAVALGAAVERWTPREEQGWYFDPDDLAGLVGPQTRLIVVNFPHNPTGFLPCWDDLLRVIETARGAGAHLFCDEMYRFLEQDPADRLPSAPEIYERALSLCGVSKTYGLAGLRVGWLVTRDAALRASLQRFKDYLTICGSAPSEILATIALRSHGRIVARHVERIRRNMDAVERLIEAHRDRLAWVRPGAGSTCFPRLLGATGASELARRLLAERDVMVAPAGVFGYGDRHIRVGLGRENLPDVLAIVDDFLGDGAGRRRSVGPP